MGLSYAATSNTDGGTIAAMMGFLSLMFLACLAFTFWAWWRIKSPAKPEDPNTMSYAEQRLLGAPLGGTIPNAKPRLRALRVHLRRNSRTFNSLFLVIGIIFTIFAAIFLIIFLSAFFFQQSWLAKMISSNFYYLGPYILFPLFTVLGIVIIITFIFNIKFWAIKNRAPIHVINLTDTALNIHLRGIFIGETYPGAEIDNKKVLSTFDNYLIEAKDESGKILFSKDFSLDELDKTEWNIKIEHLMS